MLHNLWMRFVDRLLGAAGRASRFDLDNRLTAPGWPEGLDSARIQQAVVTSGGRTQYPLALIWVGSRETAMYPSRRSNFLVIDGGRCKASTVART